LGAPQKPSRETVQTEPEPARTNPLPHKLRRFETDFSERGTWRLIGSLDQRSRRKRIEAVFLVVLDFRSVVCRSRLSLRKVKLSIKGALEKSNASLEFLAAWRKGYTVRESLQDFA
jgi:hypothetical protein